MRINHIGSSAVEGLIAKPTVDILLEIDNESNIEQLTNNLLHNGWGFMSSENKPCMKMAFNKGYTKEGFAEKVYHLHVRYYDNWNELYFREYIMEHKEVAKEYAKLKLGLDVGTREKDDIITYPDENVIFIKNKKMVFNIKDNIKDWTSEPNK